MEDNSTNKAIIIPKAPKKQNINGDQRNKRFSLFRTAMVLLRRPKQKPNATKLIKEAAKNNENLNSDGNWKKIVGSMRPLHVQDSRSPPPQLPATDKAFYIASPSQHSDDDFFAASPALSTTSWGTMSYASANSELAGSGKLRQSDSTNSFRKMSDNMSRYASALNLHDLDEQEEIEEDVEDDSDNVLEKYYESDNMIDSKADEFIARFYDQMRSQH